MYVGRRILAGKQHGFNTERKGLEWMLSASGRPEYRWIVRNFQEEIAQVVFRCVSGFKRFHWSFIFFFRGGRRMVGVVLVVISECLYFS